MTHHTGVYPGFCSMKRLGVLLSLLPLWMGCESIAELLQSWRETLRVSCPRTQHSVLGQGSIPDRSIIETSELTMRRIPPTTKVRLNTTLVLSSWRIILNNISASKPVSKQYLCCCIDRVHELYTPRPKLWMIDKKF